MDELIYQIFTKYGGILVGLTRQNLAYPRPYSFGMNGDAYSNGRKKQYSGQAPKSEAGSPLYDSVTYEVTGSGNELELDLLMLDYGTYVDRGRRPGKGIPVSVSKEIAERFFGTEKASFAINKNIKKFGIQPTNFITSALATFNAQYRAQMEAEIIKAMQSGLDDELQNI